MLGIIAVCSISSWVWDYPWLHFISLGATIVGICTMQWEEIRKLRIWQVGAILLIFMAGVAITTAGVMGVNGLIATMIPFEWLTWLLSMIWTILFLLGITVLLNKVVKSIVYKRKWSQKVPS